MENSSRLQNEIFKAKQQEKEYEEAIEQLHMDLANVEKENAKLRKAIKSLELGRHFPI